MIEVVAEIIEFISSSWHKGPKKKPAEHTEENNNE